MKLRDYLYTNGIQQKEFADRIKITRSHLSCIINNHRKPSMKVAYLIEAETGGKIKAKKILSGKALGYDGIQRRVHK